MKTYIRTVNTVEEKDKWLKDKPPGMPGKKYIAELVPNSNQWKIYITEDK